MRVATYNVRVDTDFDENWQWSYRSHYVKEVILAHNWDICCLQEVRPNQITELTKAFPTYAALLAERDGDGLGEGLLLFYKKTDFKEIKHGFFWLSTTPEVASIHPEAAYARICLYAVLVEKKTNRAFLVITTHLDNLSENARQAGMRVLLHQLKAEIASYPTILLGDLNAEKEERVHQLLAPTFTNAKEIPSSFHYGPKGTFQDFDYDLAWSDLAEIDYIYVKQMDVSKTFTWTDSCDRRFPSDHFPLEAQLEIVEKR